MEHERGAAVHRVRRLKGARLWAIPALALIGASLWARWNLDPAISPRIIAWKAVNEGTAASKEKALSLYLRAMLDDSADPYRWADLADAELAAGHKDQARTAYERAGQLAPSTPQIWVRSANFYFGLDQPEIGLRHAARALRLVPNFDDVVFSNFDRFAPAPAEVLAQIGGDRRAVRAYAKHLVQTGRLDDGEKVWIWVFQHRFSDTDLAISFVEGYLRAHRYADAQRIWGQQENYEHSDYLCPNLVFNGSFERELTSSPLDWRITRSEEFETVPDNSIFHDGKTSLRISFAGVGNVAYSHLIQSVPVLSGKYRFEAWVKTEAITTNEGPRIKIMDAENPGQLEVSLGPFGGTTEWRHAENRFAIPERTHLAAIKVVRQPSQKFDNKISGTFWIDSVKLTRE